MKRKYRFSEESFENLMQNRIYKVLLICSTYDAFILEEDGRIDEQIFNEYVELNLRYPPHFIHVSSAKEALKVLYEQDIDLVINMLSIGDMDPFRMSRKIKQAFPEIPHVVLTPFSRETNLRLQREDLSSFDYIFSWLGNSELLLAIIKLIEDKMNAPSDTKLGVQIILLIEDSVRFYSSYLPLIYKLIFEQAEKFSSEALNEHQKTILKRARPKILLARNYEEALNIYNNYKNNILGVISDIGFPVEGQRDPLAGIKLAQKILDDNPLVPVLLQSSEEKYRQLAENLGLGFLNKNSKTLLRDLKRYIKEDFAFGDFIFRDPKTKEEILRIPDLKTLQEKIFEIPDEPLRYHLSRHHFSKWLKARALFNIGNFLRDYSIDEFKDLREVREFIYETIEEFRKAKSKGIIAKFDLDKYDRYVPFARVGSGSMGGKARGLAFLNLILKRHPELEDFQNITVKIPRTVVLTTEVFDKFMENNNLYEIALSNATDQEILQAFNRAKFPEEYLPYIRKFLETTDKPIAVRSSSLLEDSHYQPFAGVYSTYMLPKFDDIDKAVDATVQAIKCVYASVYFEESKAYMQITQNVIDEEKMGIVIQEICGSQYEQYFYPLISGVARSINVYPIGEEKPEEGIVNLAFGLGKQIVEGELSLRFSPAHPDKILQLNDPKTALTQTQKTFYALDLSKECFTPSADDTITLKKLRIREAEKHGTLDLVASVYDFENDIIRDGTHYKGKKIVTFANFLKYQIFPLPQLISKILEIGQKEMNLPVEIEFAMNIEPHDKKNAIFSLLQIRPIVDPSKSITEDLTKIDKSKVIVYSEAALGHGVLSDIYDIIYVRPENFDPAKNREIATLLNELNRQMINQGKNYILIGPGRWGSRDPWLGIPVKWADISAAKVIVEAGLPDYQIEPSQGTHFFHNITSFKVGYFTVNDFRGEGIYDVQFLNALPAKFENQLIRHVACTQPFVVKMDGKKRIGVILKPEKS